MKNAPHEVTTNYGNGGMATIDTDLTKLGYVSLRGKDWVPEELMQWSVETTEWVEPGIVN